MADYKEILYDKQRGGVLITLNRPEALNAMTPTGEGSRTSVDFYEMPVSVFPS